MATFQRSNYAKAATERQACLDAAAQRGVNAVRAALPRTLDIVETCSTDSPAAAGDAAPVLCVPYADGVRGEFEYGEDEDGYDEGRAYEDEYGDVPGPRKRSSRSSRILSQSLRAN